MKYLTVTILLIAAVTAWMYAFSYYKDHESSIWLQLEEVVENITFPFKLAELYRLEPLTSLRIPVHGVKLSDIRDSWGDARSLGRTHEGTDIFAPRGTPVYAAAPGFVLRTGENPLGGTVVFTVGPGGIRYYYAHLDSIASGIDVGTPVTTDTVVGFVGNTGNAVDTSPHLHFGLYRTAAENPYPLLIDR